LGPGQYRILIDETFADANLVPPDEDDRYAFMATHLTVVLTLSAWRFFGVDEAAKLLRLRDAEGDKELVKHFNQRGRTTSLVMLSGVVQALVRSGVRVDFGPVIEVVAFRNRHDSVGVLTERARLALRRRLPHASEPGRIVDLTPRFERAVSERVERHKGVGALAVPKAELDELLQMMQPHLDGNGVPSTVVVHMPGLRPHIEELVKVRWPDTAVLSESELLDQWWSPAATVDLAAREEEGSA
jgi:flagellar biosynthesis component FlhA